MKTKLLMIPKHLFIVSLVLFFASGCSFSGANKRLYKLSSGVSVSLAKNDMDKWGISVEKYGKAFLGNPEPVNIEIFDDSKVVATLKSGYDSFISLDGNFIATGSIAFNNVKFNITDKWSEVDGALRVDRKVQVEGNLPGGFMSGVSLSYHQTAKRDKVKIFAPGMIYGGTGNLTPAAIGGSDCTDYVRIREDRLPAPMFGAFFENGTSLTILNSKPDGRTIKEDSRDLEAKTMINESLHFGAIGADFDKDKPSFGYWFPGSEGGITYEGKTYPYGQMKKWSRRYHPIRDGFRQEYQVSFRFASDNTFADYYPGAWRWAWKTLKPKIVYHDIETVKTCVLDVVSEMVWTRQGATGLQVGFPAVQTDSKNQDVWFNPRMGFVGRSLEAANYLLADSLRDSNPNRGKYRQQGEATIRSFLNLSMSPPEADGFSSGGKPFTKKGRIFLRSMCDGHMELLKSVIREREAGIEHGEWVKWSRSFADWLLQQQNVDGSFPRCWEHKTGKVLDPSPNSSYNAITFLLLLDKLTGDNRYGRAAAKAGEFCWNSSHSRGVFIGGTTDNPDVIDQEAGRISLEAYLALHEHTSDKKWLERAKVAADFTETWVYVWDVPMPEDESDKELHWKKGVSTVGLCLIAAGHSLVDQNVAYAVDEFAELYLKTKDEHYYDVSMILLHNTKSMLALPGREYDLRGAGWKQEHYSVAPVRGVGMHRSWVGWVSTSLLNGIIELQELDNELYDKMIKTQK